MRLIDADVLIDKYGDWYTEEGKEEGYIGTVKGIVDSIPTVTERTGHWIPLDSDDECYDTYKCSSCGNTITVDSKRVFDIGFTIEDFDCCNKCGAHMKGGENA